MSVRLAFSEFSLTLGAQQRRVRSDVEICFEPSVRMDI